MGKDLISLRMYLTVGAMLIAAGLLLIQQQANSAAAVTPQGKGGEVIAKPTPTKSRETGKSARSIIRTVSLAGTTWDWESDENIDTYEFLDGGKLKYGNAGGDGTWKRTGRRIVMTFRDPGNNPSVETGTVSGNRMNGTGRYKDENGKIKTYKWSAKLNTENE